MEYLLTIFIIFIFLLQGLAKLLERASRKKRPQEGPGKEELEEYFRSIGFPPTEVAEEEPKKEAAVVEPERKQKAEKVEIPPPKIKKGPPKIEAPAIEERPPYCIPTPLSKNKLQEGIILSVILGPPRARRITPEW